MTDTQKSTTETQSLISISKFPQLDEARVKAATAAFETLRRREDVGFFQVMKRDSLWKTSQERGDWVKKNFDRLVVMGIGGSSLGGRALRMAVKPEDQTIEFFENVDGSDFWRRLRAMGDLKRVHFAAISKSGNTIETLTQLSFIVETLGLPVSEIGKHFTVISELRENPLTKWAKQNQVPVLEIPVDIGGRYSVLTPVGLFPAAFLGCQLSEIRAGAEWSFGQTQLVSQLAAQSFESWKREEWITVFWTYCDQMRDFGLWIQQLWAESLGKKVNRKGGPAPRVSTPIALMGTNDQHSVLQQIIEGTRDKFIWFIRVSQAETSGPVLKQHLFDTYAFLKGQPLGRLLGAEAQATSEALELQGTHNLTLSINQPAERQVGALFMLLELVVGTLGEMIDIDAFNQPGVELGKRLARDILMSHK